MTRRPDPFNQSALEDALRALGCPDSCIATTISNYRLFVPLLFARLGEEGVFDIICNMHQQFGLGEQYAAWRSSTKYLVAWAERELEDYQARRSNSTGAEQPKQKDELQPRLFD